ncbi:MAG TPA: hypothetical protein VLA32_11400 [Anaerolineales bacterium]|nr:hypothetical protein [Anaerolineales bacterium]
MTEENNDTHKKQERYQKKFDPVGFILALVLVGVIVVIAMEFFAPTIGNAYPYLDDLSYRATQAALNCDCSIRRDAWWDGLPEGKLVVITAKTLVLGRPNQAIALTYSTEKFSNDEIDERIQNILNRLNLSEDKANIIETDIFLDTWGYLLLNVPATNFSFEISPQFIDPRSVTEWEMSFSHGDDWLEGSYDFWLRFFYHEERSESARCRRTCGGNKQSLKVPTETKHMDVNLVLQDQTSEYPLVENFNSSQEFVSTDPDLSIRDGYVYWEISRSEGVQYIYRTIPPFSGDVILTVTGQIDGYTGNCEVRVGIGDGIPELGEAIHDSGISIHLGFVGESCPVQQGPVVRASGAEIYDKYVEAECSKSGAIWVYDETPLTVSLTVDGHATTSPFANLLLENGPIIGTLIGLGGDLIYFGEYNTLFVGLTDNQAGASCWGKIDSVVIQPQNDELYE